MKKGKLLILGLIALMLAGGLVLASCGDKCPGNYQTGNKECHNYDYYSSSSSLADRVACENGSCAVNKEITSKGSYTHGGKQCDCQ